MNIIKGDLIQLALNGEFEVIVHGCNCFFTMGAGIAKHIKSSFPAAYEADLSTPKGSKEKLGTISHAVINSQLTVVNAYTQYDWRGKGIKVDYDAVKTAFHTIKTDFSGKKIGYPMIGAGLAGGDWSIISAIIDEALEGEDHTVVIYKT